MDGIEETTQGEMNEDNASTERHEEEEVPIALGKHPRACVKPIPHAITNYLNYGKVSTNYKSFRTNLNQISIPNTATEAAQYPHWKQAMNEEMQALIKKIEHRMQWN